MNLLYEFLTARSSFGISRIAYWFTCLGVVLFMFGWGLSNREAIADYLLERLTYERHIPSNTVSSSSSRADAVYILGGYKKSLEAKFRSAALLIKEGRAARVLVLSSQSLMEFDPSFERNLTTDEWSIRTLKSLGVPAQMIEPVVFKQGFFGTWSEAKGLSHLAMTRGYQRLILVTSPYHSRRTWESFSHTFVEGHTSLYLYLSNEPVRLHRLVIEYIKLLFYRALLF